MIDKIAKDVLDKLKTKFPAFINEAHFQYEFALELANMGYEVELEKYIKAVPSSGKSTGRVDLIAMKEDKKYAFEFKYATTSIKVINGAITLHLKKQDGGKQRKIAIWRDVERLETLKRKKECNEACFIFITNDIPFIISKSKYSDLDINPGLKSFTGKKIEYNIKERGTIKTKTITIRGTYDLQYDTYSTIITPPNEFKALILEII